MARPKNKAYPNTFSAHPWNNLTFLSYVGFVVEGEIVSQWDGENIVSDKIDVASTFLLSKSFNCSIESKLDEIEENLKYNYIYDLLSQLLYLFIRSE